MPIAINKLEMRVILLYFTPSIKVAAVMVCITPAQSRRFGNRLNELSRDMLNKYKILSVKLNRNPNNSAYLICENLIGVSELDSSVL